MTHTRDDDARRGARPDEAVSCAAYREDIPLVVGGDLEPEVLDLLVAHLAGCEPCARATALAASARDALLGGLVAGAHEWREPALWPELEPALPQRATPVHSFREHALRVGRRLALPLAAAAVVVLMLPRGQEVPEPAPSPAPPGELTAAGAESAPHSTEGAGLVSSVDPVFDRYGSGLVPAGLGEDQTVLPSLPRGFGVPLNARELEELRRADELRPQLAGGVIVIRNGREEALASFPR